MLTERRQSNEGRRPDIGSGYVVIELADGDELWVSADWEGCQIFATWDYSKSAPPNVIRQPSARRSASS